ncbi:hypothetical protein [Streptomyces sp. NPDC093261]|uniref:hypothetical protein n=1 Tax=Streptomyces sp. NPDC093261 TaxID=3366037 RepID=UPI0037F3D92B
MEEDDRGDRRASDGTLALIAAATLSAALNALVGEHHRRIDGGETSTRSPPTPPNAAHRAFDLLAKGLNGYAVKA